MNQLYIISIDYQNFTNEERVQLKLESGVWDELKSYLQGLSSIKGFVRLNTCNRVELFFESTDSYHTQILEYWKGVSIVKNPYERIKIYSGYEECIEHILQLSLGLKSAILGDDQIIQQLKLAFEDARMNDHLSTMLERAYQIMMRCHKRVCNSTDYKSSTVSLAFCTLKKIMSILNGMHSDKTVLIVGAGGMAQQIVKYVEKFDFRSVNLTNRTLRNAEAVCKGKNINVIPFDDLGQTGYDVIINCIDNGCQIISSLPSPDVYVDLSVGFNSKQKSECEVISLHDMLDQLAYHSKNKKKAITQVSEITDEFVSLYSNWVKSWMERRKVFELSKRLTRESAA